MSARIAVLGCGYWGGNHIRTLSSLGALSAVSDRNPERAEAFARDFGCRAVSPKNLFDDSGIDAVVLALPPQFHADAIVEAVAAGKHVLVEKPIALTVDDAERAVDTARSANRVLLVGHVLRYHPAFERLQGLIADGELGDVGYMHSHRLGLGRFHTDSDALWDLAPHDLSMMLAITGASPVEVRGEGAALLDELSDFAHLHLRFAGGTRAHLFASRLNPYRERRLTVVGSRAMAGFNDVGDWDRKLAVYRHAVWKDDGRWAFTEGKATFVPVAEGMPLTRECQHFIDCIEGRATPRTTGEEAVDILRILTAGTVLHGERTKR